MTRKPMRALVRVPWPCLIFSGLPAEVKMVKPPKINIKRRMRPAITKIKGMRRLMMSARLRGLPDGPVPSCQVWSLASRSEKSSSIPPVVMPGNWRASFLIMRVGSLVFVGY